MTTEGVVAESAGGGEEKTLSMPDIAVSMAGYVAQLVQHDRGGFASLRRMNPDAPDAPAFWRVMARYDQLNRGSDLELKWALIVHGIALMTPTQSGDGLRSAHDGSMAVGSALFLGGEVQRGSAYYSESRLSRLLNARGPILRALLSRMFRMLGARGVTFNWREMAQFVLNEDHPEWGDESRRRIARWYYSANRAAERQTEQTG